MRARLASPKGLGCLSEVRALGRVIQCKEGRSPKERKLCTGKVERFLGGMRRGFQRGNAIGGFIPR